MYFTLPKILPHILISYIKESQVFFKAYLNIKFETLCEMSPMMVLPQAFIRPTPYKKCVDTGEDGIVYVISFAKIFPLLSD